MSDSDTGALSTELAVLTPVLIGFMLFAVFAGRVTQAQSDVAHAAHEAARAASLTGDLVSANEAATQTARANLPNGVACRRLEITVDGSQFRAGGQVAVTVSCQASFADLALLAVPGTRQFSTTAIEVIDTYRANQEPNP